jgi:hypothetical protein
METSWKDTNLEDEEFQLLEYDAMCSLLKISQCLEGKMLPSPISFDLKTEVTYSSKMPGGFQ